jgi:hypothetical protein
MPLSARATEVPFFGPAGQKWGHFVYPACRSAPLTARVLTLILTQRSCPQPPGRPVWPTHRRFPNTDSGDLVIGDEQDAGRRFDSHYCR